MIDMQSLNPLENFVHNLELGYYFDEDMLYATEDKLMIRI